MSEVFEGVVVSGECIRTTIDAEVEAGGFGALLEGQLKRAFCYDERGRLAESEPYDGAPA
ncbi:hypothetical protein [Aquisphaera insulae]|uniref:hypothetical protein n=1 Tax=Aquisphaera insulae TaxID=2712864 RepID=UPI0013EC4979|nr:hypothetical protein [Aquisphaera insulae]